MPNHKDPKIKLQQKYLRWNNPFVVLFTKTYTQIRRRGLCSESFYCDTCAYQSPARTSASSLLGSLTLELLFLPPPPPHLLLVFLIHSLTLSQPLSIISVSDGLDVVSLGKTHWEGPVAQALETFYHRLQRHTKI